MKWVFAAELRMLGR